ncbi:MULTISPECIES: site-specific integrase [Thiorhodovibrio]|uniref:site-specific integrase n=1 Tax=Thiorhodovibrio TaxID=61593 RepID=UPI002B259026|nr:site-specific integrase [Thiorhodovibrio litoralis]
MRSCAEYRDAHCPNSQWVFCRKDGSRMRSSSTGFARACKDVGISDFRFHDLRHTCAAWLVQAGVPLTEVRDVLGHSTIKMTERYAHLAPENIRNAVAVLDLESRFSHGAKSTKNEDAHKDAVSY